ncbi:hypothetical protein CHS0354_042849, partial [Potamilus streckersoni]
MPAFSRLSHIDVIEPARIRRRFDLDGRINPTEYRAHIISSIRTVKNMYRTNGASYVYSTYKTNNEDARLTMERAQEILSRVDFGTIDRPRRYHLQSSYLTFRETPSRRQRRLNRTLSLLYGVEIRNNFWEVTLHDGRVSDGRRGLFLLNQETLPGALVGVDQKYYTRDYPYNVVVYGLYLVPIPVDQEVGTERMSTTSNCVAELVIKHFKESTRGNGLTQRRANIISAWNNRVFDAGASKKDIIELEKKLKIPIIVKMLPDRVFYNSGCYRSKGAAIEILDHNFHGWGIGDRDFPLNKTIRYYTGDIFHWIKSNMKNVPVNVWLFRGGNDYDQFVMRNDSVKDNCDSGIIYRTEELQNSMIEFAK